MIREKVSRQFMIEHKGLVIENEKSIEKKKKKEEAGAAGSLVNHDGEKRKKSISKALNWNSF